MNLTNPQEEVFSDSEDYQPPFISPYNSQDNDILTISPSGQVENLQNEDATQNNKDIFIVSPHGQVAEGLHPNKDVNNNAALSHSPSVIINNLVQANPNSSTNLPIPVHPAVFFFRPPNDRYHYHINCEEIFCDTIERLLNKPHIQSNENECIFFYQQKCNNRFYRVSCEIVSPLWVNNCLNKNFLGFELQQNTEQEYLAFTVDRKEKLQYHLKQYLSQYFLN